MTLAVIAILAMKITLMMEEVAAKD